MKSFFIVIILVFIGMASHAQDTSFHQYVGKYKLNEGSPVPEVNVTLNDGVLTASSAAGTSALQQIKGDTFSIVSFGGTAAFKRNEANKVAAIHIETGGYIMDGTKDESATEKIIAAIMPSNRKRGLTFP